MIFSLKATEKPNVQTGHLFDALSRILAAPMGRRRTLQLCAASVAAAIWPRKATAQLLTCGAVSVGVTAINPTACAGLITTPPPGVCAALQTTALTGILCPTPCPVTLNSTSCVCQGIVAVFTTNAVCACPSGTACGSTCCAPGQLCCNGVCTATSCTNCTACGVPCPAGNCCVGGLCLASNITPPCC